VVNAGFALIGVTVAVVVCVRIVADAAAVGADRFRRVERECVGFGIAGPTGGPTVSASMIIIGTTATITVTSSAPVDSLFLRAITEQVP
jgi:hypothetical protein